MRLTVRLILGVGLALFSHGLYPLTAAAALDVPYNRHSGQGELESRLVDLATSLGQPAVDARVDRVWHAVPGLCGLKLDVEASMQKTTRLNDQHLHLVWKQVPPKNRLQDMSPEPIYRGTEAEKSVSLMFNVSWGEEYIPSILDTLAKRHVKATFFLDGAWVKKHPDLAREIALAGHAVGSHGSGHPDFRKLGRASLEQQVTRTNQVIQQTTGKVSDLIAPPAGSYDMRLVKIAHQHGLHTILWTADTIDWKRPPASVIVQRATGRISNGSLILMHPTGPTAQALPKVIESLQSLGFSLKTVEDVVEEKRTVFPPVVLSKRP